MALPHGFRKNIKIIKDKVGFERRQEILDDIDKNGTYLPRGVMYEDMDKSFIEFVEKDLVAKKDVVITITGKGYVKRIDMRSYHEQKRIVKGIPVQRYPWIFLSGGRSLTVSRNSCCVMPL